MEDRLLTLDEVAWYLRLSHMTVYRMIQRGEIRAVKVGNQWRFSKEAIERWRDENISFGKGVPARVTAKPKSSWETKHGSACREYIQDIIDTRPDIGVLMQRRGQRLLAELIPSDYKGVVCNFQAIELMPDVEISTKYVALVDDSRQHGRTLYKARKYLEDRGASVHTFAFVGREPFSSQKGEPQDRETNVCLELADNDFTTACAELTDHLLMQGRTQDTDHFAVFLALRGEKRPVRLKEFLEFLGKLGAVFVIPSPAEANGFVTITLDCPNFAELEVVVGGLPIVLILQDGVMKFRFYYDIQNDTAGCLALTMPKVILNIHTYFENEARDTILPLDLKKMGLKYEHLTEEQKAVACYRDLSLNLSLIMLEQLIERLNARDSAFQVSLIEPFITREDLEYSYGRDLGKKLSERIVQHLSKIVKIQTSTVRQPAMFDEQTETLLPFLSESRMLSRQLEAVQHILPVVKLLVREYEREKQGLTFSEICQRLEADMEQWEVSFALDLGLDRTLIAPDYLRTKLGDGLWEFRKGYHPGEAAPGDPPEQVGHGDSKALDPALRRFRRDKFLVPFVLDRLMKYCPTQQEGVEPFLACKVMACLILDWLKKGERREWSSWEAPAAEFGPLPQIPTSSSVHERGGNLYELAQDGEAFYEFKPVERLRGNRFVPRDGWQKVVSDYYDEDELANIDKYLEFYSRIFNRLDGGRTKPAVDNLLTLSACFDEESTYRYAYYNLLLWQERFNDFLNLCRQKFAVRTAEGLSEAITGAERTALLSFDDTESSIGKVTRYQRVGKLREALEQTIDQEGDIVLSKLVRGILGRVKPQGTLTPRLLSLKVVGELMKAVATMTKYLVSRVRDFGIPDRREEEEKGNRLDYYLARVRKQAVGLVKSEALLTPFEISDESLSLPILQTLLDPIDELYQDICRIFYSQCPTSEPILEVDPFRRISWVNFVKPRLHGKDSALMCIRLDKFATDFSQLLPLEISRVNNWCAEEVEAIISQFKGKVCMRVGNSRFVAFSHAKNALSAAVRMLRDASQLTESAAQPQICIGVCRASHPQGRAMSKQELDSKIVLVRKLAHTRPGGLYIGEDLAKTAEKLGIRCEVQKAPDVEEKVMEVRWSEVVSELSAYPTKPLLERITPLEKLAPMGTLKLLNDFSNEEQRAGTNLSHIDFLLLPHLVEDLYGFLLAMKRIGVGPGNICLVYKPYPYQKGQEIIKRLTALNYPLFPLEQRVQALDLVVSKAKSEKRQVIVVEDGGYITPLIHKRYATEISLFRGVVEQTFKGIDRVRREVGESNLQVPYRDVAESRIKADFESPAVADAAIGNIRRMLGDKRFRGEHAGLIGFGRIGSCLASELNQIPMHVHAYDTDAHRLGQARLANCLVEESSSALVEKCWLIIGATGNISVGESEILRLQDGSVLVSVSSDQEEINPAALKTLSSREPRGTTIGTEYVLLNGDRRVTLLGDGYPVNFVGAQGIPNEEIDLVLVELYLNTIALACEEATVKKSMDAKEVDDLSKKKRIIERWLKVYPLKGSKEAPPCQS